MPNALAAILLGTGWLAVFLSGDASLGLCFLATLIALNGQPWKKGRK